MKKIAKRVTIILFVFMLALTATSRTIYYVITPQITVATPGSRSLTKEFTLELALDYPAARIEYLHLAPPTPLFIDTVAARPGYSYAKGDVFATVNAAYYQTADDAYRKAIANAEDDLEVFDLDQLEQQNQQSAQHTQALKAFNNQRKALAESLQTARNTLNQLQAGTADKAFAHEVAQMESQIADMEQALAYERLQYDYGLVTLASIETQEKAIENKREELAFKKAQNADAQNESIAAAQKTVSDLERQLTDLDAESPVASGFTLRASDAQRRQKLVEARDAAVQAYNDFNEMIDDEGNLRFTRDCTVAAVHVTKGGELSGRQRLYEYVEDYAPTFRAEVSKEVFDALAVFTRFDCKIGNEMVTLTISQKDNANGASALLLTPASAINDYTLDRLRASGTVSSPVTIETQYYETVVPREAVQGIESGGTKGTVYVLSTRASYFGDEQFVQAYEVRILDSDHAYAAVEFMQRPSMGSIIAVKRNAPLADGVAVVVRENLK